jgi:3-oxoacyl-[acyl-carrier-protein] synthase II
MLMRRVVVTGIGRELETQYVTNNNFAFGGVNHSMIFGRWG